MRYTCLSIDQPYASMIIQRLKTIEVRSWAPKYRGDIMICSTAFDFDLNETEYLPGGHALGLVTLADVRPLKKSDCDAAALEDEDFQDGMFAWILENPRQIKPIPVKGQQRLYHKNIDPIFVKGLYFSFINISWENYLQLYYYTLYHTIFTCKVLDFTKLIFYKVLIRY